MLVNARFMLGYFGAWLHLREIEALLIEQHREVHTIEDPLTSQLPWDAACPWPLRLLKIIHAYMSHPLEERKRGKKLCDQVSPSDVLDSPLSDQGSELDSPFVPLRALCTVNEDLKDDLQYDSDWEFEIQRALAVIATWLGLRPRSRDKSRWMLWDVRGRLIHAILLSELPSLLL
jgi:hypothetical protein